MIAIEKPNPQDNVMITRSSVSHLGSLGIVWFLCPQFEADENGADVNWFTHLGTKFSSSVASASPARESQATRLRANAVAADHSTGVLPAVDRNLVQNIADVW
jgi:hypothetical protein